MYIIYIYIIIEYFAVQLVGTIDIWWVLHDGGLLTLLPYLLTMHDVWRKCSLRLFVVITKEGENKEELVRRAEFYLAKAHISAHIEAIDLLCPSTYCLAVYEQTLDINARLKLLESYHSHQQGE